MDKQEGKLWIDKITKITINKIKNIYQSKLYLKKWIINYKKRKKKVEKKKEKQIKLIKILKH